MMDYGVFLPITGCIFIIVFCIWFAINLIIPPLVTKKKRSDLQQKIKDRIAMRIRENHYASNTTDYEIWAFAHFLADELISLIEEQGMQPPAYETYVKVIVEKDEPLGMQDTDTWEKEEEST